MKKRTRPRRRLPASRPQPDVDAGRSAAGRPPRPDAGQPGPASAWRTSSRSVLAALACETPMLLIGPHGSAKSRCSSGWRWRSACAAGTTTPPDQLRRPGGLPAARRRWSCATCARRPRCGARRAVFLDEISRCRPDVQNKLFSIIHERRVQGIAAGLAAHRWAAMNPPVQDDDEDNAYLGSQPLDLALSDRFALQARCRTGRASTQRSRKRSSAPSRCPRTLWPAPCGTAGHRADRRTAADGGRAVGLVDRPLRAHPGLAARRGGPAAERAARRHGVAQRGRRARGAPVRRTWTPRSTTRHGSQR